MRIPRKFLIGDSIWTVRFVKKFGFGEKDQDTRGLCKPDTQEILIQQGLSTRERLDTLIHEVLHALEFEYEIDIDHKLIYKLEGKIAQFLIDNFLGRV